MNGLGHETRFILKDRVVPATGEKWRKIGIEL